MKHWFFTKENIRKSSSGNVQLFLKITWEIPEKSMESGRFALTLHAARRSDQLPPLLPASPVGCNVSHPSFS